jgi:ureidoacrylate peracid hydrolase
MDTVRLDPVRTALIDVDMQRCFVEGTPLASPDGLELVDRVNRVSAACREAGALVVHTRMWMRADGTNIGVMGQLVPPFIVDLYTEGAPSAELHDRLEVAPTDVIVNKPRYGAFSGTDLELLLRSHGVDTVVISGIATNICCETTAREAAQRDFRVLFLSDGTATKEMDGVPAAALQQATCSSLSMVFARITTVDAVISALGAQTPSAAVR